MEREIDMKEISDGRLYGLQDMVKADCADCKGCSACCQGMGESIVLDPLDSYRLCIHLSVSFDELLAEEKIALHVVDGVILPNLQMTGETERCVFLNAQGRCSIHPFRPGLCRLFPLGRFYEGNSFRYFLQVHECRNGNRAKVKVRKWIDTPHAKENEKFIADWHYFLKKLQKLTEGLQDEALVRDLNLYVLRSFYQTAWSCASEADFYKEFRERLAAAGRYAGFA